MTTEESLAQWLIGWMIVAAIIAWDRLRGTEKGTGLVLAYLLSFWLNYWLATALYLIPWYSHFELGLVQEGFKQSAYGLFAFAFGSVVLSPILIKFFSASSSTGTLAAPTTDIPKAYLSLGIASFVLGPTPIGSIPTLSTILTNGQNLFVVGLCLYCWQAWLDIDKKTFVRCVGAIVALPFVTILTRGFFGYGAAAACVVLAFIASFVRLSWKVIPVGLVIGYVGLSFYVTYMRGRNEVREVVWAGEAAKNRFDSVYKMMNGFEWFDPSNERQLWLIDTRMNQSFLAGAAVDSLSNSQAYAYGETIWHAVVGLVPRVLWPNKPTSGGSGTLVSDYTGIRFPEGTSVGIGQVMEFYINFGTTGLMLCFLVLGVALTIIDDFARQRLVSGDWYAFALWFTVGIPFLQVAGQLVEITSSAAASLVLVLAVNRYLSYRFQNKQSVGQAEHVEPGTY